MAKHRLQKEESTAVAPPSTTLSVSFDIIKANDFRGIHADGVWGGLTPQGLMSMTFYSERFPIPQQLTHEVSSQGSLGRELVESRVTRRNIVREAEACVYMNIEVARAFYRFLGEQLAVFDSKKASTK